MANKENAQKEPKKQGGKRAALRANRRARRNSLYAAQFSITEKNQRRRLTRHVRSNPQDTQARKLHEKRVGATASLQCTARGRKRAIRSGVVLP